MTFEEINRRAARREPLPDALPPSERTAYLALCLLYELHRHFVPSSLHVMIIDDRIGKVLSLFAPICPRRQKR